MSLEILSKDIFSKAQQEVQIIESDYKKKVSDLKVAAEKEVEMFKEQIDRQFDDEIALSREKVLGQYQREAKKIILEAKTDVMIDIEDQVYEQLLSLSPQHKEQLYKKLLSVATKELDVKTVYASSEDVQLVSKLAPKGVKVVSKPQLKGLLFESEDKKQLLDLSLKTLLKDALARNDEAIQTLLFGHM